MAVLIFIIVIVALILVHEAGHFFVAKWAGIRVDEFGLGYPPRAATLGHVGETAITLNWLPFGGFVKIYGEDGEQSAVQQGSSTADSFTSKNRFIQALVLIAGIVMNLLFAYVLLTTSLALGTPRALTASEVAHATNVQLAVAGVVAGSPATTAGVQPGDTIRAAHEMSGATWAGSDPASFSTFIAQSAGEPVSLSVLHNGKIEDLVAVPTKGLVASDPARYALGVEVATIGVVPLSFGASIVQGARLTYAVTIETARALLHFFAGIFTLSANLSQVTGPIGIAGAVGSAAHTGFGDLLSLVALISINLALINLIPVPALDGGRLLFVLIEAVTRRKIKPSIAQSVNAVGFALLVLLMVVVTAHDLYKIVG